jgi:DNA-binding MarR family transcriptional regulator
MMDDVSNEVISAWTRTVRLLHRVSHAVELDLKRSGLPPVIWNDALLELAQAPAGTMRSIELERRIVLRQYSLSRLINRLVESGLVERRPCEDDKRGLCVAITPAGRDLQKRSSRAYSTAVKRCVGAALSDADLVRLSDIFGRLDAVAAMTDELRETRPRGRTGPGLHG